MAATNCCLSLLPSRLSCPGQPPTVFGTGGSVPFRSYFPLVVYAARGTPYAVCARNNPSTPPEASYYP
jgi:hypothetical protein